MIDNIRKTGVSWNCILILAGIWVPVPIEGFDNADWGI